MKKIKIYTTNWCSYCNLAKRFFDEKGWDYEEINIEKLGWDRSKLLEVGKAKTVPQIVIDGEAIAPLSVENSEPPWFRNLSKSELVFAILLCFIVYYKY